jgi:hypothetical protein
MDFDALDQGGWASYLPMFKNVFRPSSAASPVVQMDEFESCGEAITQARADDATFGALGDRLVDLVFDGYLDWHRYEDEWILRELAQVLSADDQEQGLLDGLQTIGAAIDDDARRAALQEFVQTVEQYVNVWQAEAEEQGYTRVEAVDEAVVLEGTPNTENWRANRIPGTLYYAYVDGRYLYSDLPEGPISEWETVQVRQQLAADLATEWGTGFCTPTGGDPAYGADYVFALDKLGPWMTQADIEAAMAESAPESAEAASPEAIVVERWGEQREAKLDELFAELTALGWNPDAAEHDESMPTREEIIELFDRRVGSGI